MTGEDKDARDGKHTLYIFADVVEILKNTDPADVPRALEKLSRQRKEVFNQAKATSLYEEAGRTLRALPKDERDKFYEDIGCIENYFEETDPEPLVRRLISGPLLSRAGQLLLASALAGLATANGGDYGTVLREVPNPRGRPWKSLGSDDITRLADRVAEVEKTEGKKYPAVKIVAAENNMSERKLWHILAHEEWARGFEGRRSDDDE